MFKKMRYYWR